MQAARRLAYVWPSLPQSVWGLASHWSQVPWAAAVARAASLRMGGRQEGGRSAGVQRATRQWAGGGCLRMVGRQLCSGRALK